MNRVRLSSLLNAGRVIRASERGRGPSLKRRSFAILERRYFVPRSSTGKARAALPVSRRPDISRLARRDWRAWMGWTIGERGADAPFAWAPGPPVGDPVNPFE